jgi:hypothetical protein
MLVPPVKRILPETPERASGFIIPDRRGAVNKKTGGRSFLRGVVENGARMGYNEKNAPGRRRRRNVR